MEKEFLAAFADIVREQLVKKNEVEIDGLGTFRSKHIKQVQEQYPNGRVVMMPPRDVIRFISDNNSGV
ncbi:MAG: HU family DNA-binding protein [Balneolaceae bacterium]|nr:HU family DNA-binding protein [Balneolaceae bacterium]